jgi:hypothetical protein
MCQSTSIVNIKCMLYSLARNWMRPDVCDKVHSVCIHTCTLKSTWNWQWSNIVCIICTVYNDVTCAPGHGHMTSVPSAWSAWRQCYTLLHGMESYICGTVPWLVHWYWLYWKYIGLVWVQSAPLVTWPPDPCSITLHGQSKPYLANVGAKCMHALNLMALLQ